MSSIWTVLKWIGKSMLLLFSLLIAAGLLARISGPDPHPPQGTLVDIGGCKLHINATGQKQADQPTLVIEGGNGLATEFYHWLSEGLQDRMRVVRYDRAGIGYSEASNTPRDPETIARELHALLEKAGESPPYLLAGHSLGGPYVRVFAQLYPDEVAGMLLLDTTHPEQVKRNNLPLADSWTFRGMIQLQYFQAVLADLGILLLYDLLHGPFLGRRMEGLPDTINDRTLDFLLGGKYIRAMTKEMTAYHTTLERAGQTNSFGNLPIRIFTAAQKPSQAAYEEYLKKGIDMRQKRLKKIETQAEFLELSSNSQQILVDGHHTSIFTVREHAAVICEVVRELLGG